MAKNPPSTSNIALLYVPCGSEDEATSIARTLLQERLIACANIYRSRSLYMWKGALSDEEEHVLFCKTAPSRVGAVERRVRALHTYEVPCILQMQAAHVNHDYAAWVAGEVLGPEPVLATGQVQQESSPA